VLKVDSEAAQALFGILGETLDSISDGVQIIGPDWRYLYVNAAACRHGRRTREELLGRTMPECYPGIQATPLFAVLASCMQDRKARRLDNAFSFEDGSAGLFELRVEPCAQGIFVLSVDVTERRRLEVELRQVQKLDTLGQLAGGVAHDFNNLLTAMQGFAGFALAQIGDGHAAAEDIREVLDAVERAGALTRQLLSFSRQAPIAARIVDINGLVASVERLLERLIGEDIQLATKLCPEPCRTHIDPAAFEQLAINLVLNARDAMPSGGDVTIETFTVTMDEPRAMSHGQVIPAGDYVVLAVTDEGTGIEPADLEKLFEPVYATRPARQGTGLGLSTAYATVRQAGGYIWVHAEPRQGATFRVYLPRARGPVSEVVAEPPVRATNGDETILLVEDDPQVRHVAERVLARCGYTVLVAADAQEASALVAEHGRSPHLLLTDMTLPGSSGHQLAAHLGGRHPGMRVLFISGYTEATISRRATLPAGAPLLTKPFSADTLARRVRQVLDDDAAAAGPLDDSEQAPLVLIVDDDELLRRSLRRQLTILGCEVIEAGDGGRAMRLARDAAPAAIFVDLYMPGTDGHTLLRRLPHSGVTSPIVVMSGGGNMDDVIGALRNGACDYLKKPWSKDDLASSLGRALDLHRIATGDLS
jgi:signal transduction histidine kinase/DNA-binding response OmpR family regulator